MGAENVNRRLNIYINDKEVVNSMSGITGAVNKTRNELRRLERGSADYDSELKRLTDQLTDLTERQNEFREELRLNNHELGAARENFSSLLDGLSTGDMNAVQTSMMGIRASIVSTAKAGWAFVATPIGAMIAGLVGFGVAAKAVFDFNEEIRESNKLLDNLGLDKTIRPAIEGIVKTYKVGFEELANAVDNMVDLGLVKDEFEALEQIKAGLVKAPNANEFLATLDANGIAAKNLGLTLQGVIDLNESFEASGANAEAVFGALQKSSSTLILQSPQLKQSLENAFGAGFTKELLDQVKSGSISYYDALDKIHKKGEEIGISNRQQAQLAKDLFGKSSIAAGGYEMILGTVSKAQAKQTEELTETQKQVEALAESNIELAKAMDEALKSDGFNSWKNDALIAFNTVKQGFFQFLNDITSTANSRIKQAREGGAQDGVDTFARLLGNKQGAEAVKEAESLLRMSTKNIAIYRDKVKAIEEEIKNYSIFTGGINSDGERVTDVGLQKDKEKLVRFLNEQIAIKRQADKLLNPEAKAEAKADNSLSEEEKKEAEDAAKKREKALADAKKHSDDLAKTEADLQKQLLETKRAYQDLNFGLIHDEYTRERDLLNIEYDRKIEDLKANIKKERDAIEKLKSGIANPKSSNEDISSFKRQLNDRKEIQENYNATLVSLEQTRDLKLGALHEKFLQQDIKKQEEANARELQSLQTKHNNELSAITSLKEAKDVLSEYLTDSELNKITTLEGAKKKIKEQFLKEEYELQEKHLLDMIAKFQAIFAQEQITGIQLITPEEREAILKFLDDAALKLSALGVKGAEGETDKAAEGIKALSGIDILGFSPEQWQNTFDSLDTFAEKIAAVEMVTGAMQKAFGKFFQFMDAGDQRSLQKFQRNNDNKKKALSDQLEKGYITQEVYTSRVAKLDQEMEKKQAELEYKKAKRQKIQAALQIVVNTAIAVMKAIAESPMTVGMPWSAIIAGLGAVELGLVLSQPLPPKSGYKVGGYTGDGSPDGVAGDVHHREYVIPQKVLFSNDPVVPSIVGYLEQKRKGKNPVMSDDSISVPSSGGVNNQSRDQENSVLIPLLIRTTAVLEKLERDGVEANLVNSIQNAKKMKEKIKELDKLKLKAKA